MLGDCRRYARGRDEVNKEWEAKTRTQASSQAQTTSMRDKAHAEELDVFVEPVGMNSPRGRGGSD